MKKTKVYTNDFSPDPRLMNNPDNRPFWAINETDYYECCETRAYDDSRNDYADTGKSCKYEDTTAKSQKIPFDMTYTDPIKQYNPSKNQNTPTQSSSTTIGGPGARPWSRLAATRHREGFTYTPDNGVPSGQSYGVPPGNPGTLKDERWYKTPLSQRYEDADNPYKEFQPMIRPRYIQNEYDFVRPYIKSRYDQWLPKDYATIDPFGKKNTDYPEDESWNDYIPEEINPYQSSKYAGTMKPPLRTRRVPKYDTPEVSYEIPHANNQFTNNVKTFAILSDSFDPRNPSGQKFLVENLDEQTTNPWKPKRYVMRKGFTDVSQDRSRLNAEKTAKQMEFKNIDRQISIDADKQMNINIGFSLPLWNSQDFFDIRYNKNHSNPAGNT